MRYIYRIPIYQNECSKAHHRGRAVVIEVSSAAFSSSAFFALC